VDVFSAPANGPAFIADVQMHFRHGPIDGHNVLLGCLAPE
jgi:hypothetical protein